MFKNNGMGDQKMKLFLILNGHNNHVVATSFSPDSSLLLSASRDTIVIMWDSHSGEKLLEFGYVWDMHCIFLWISLI